jgi:hypothetical protein
MLQKFAALKKDAAEDEQAVPRTPQQTRSDPAAEDTLFIGPQLPPTLQSLFALLERDPTFLETNQVGYKESRLFSGGFALLASYHELTISHNLWPGRDGRRFARLGRALPPHAVDQQRPGPATRRPT